MRKDVGSPHKPIRDNRIREVHPQTSTSDKRQDILENAGLTANDTNEFAGRKRPLVLRGSNKSRSSGLGYATMPSAQDILNVDVDRRALELTLQRKTVERTVGL